MHHFIDTHCHLDFPPLCEQIPNVLTQANLSGVERIIVPSVSQERLMPVIHLAESYQAVYAGVGFHPMYLDNTKEDDLTILADLLAQNRDKVVAVGEIGLDGSIDIPLAKQGFYLESQLMLAKQFNLSVLLHGRRAMNELLHHLKQAKLNKKGVIHGFSGSYEQARQFIDLGFMIGIGGVITYERANKTRKAIAKLPLEALVLETDAPDMPLSGRQGQPNHPKFIIEIFNCLCHLRSELPENIAHQLYQNTYQMFFE